MEPPKASSKFSTVLNKKAEQSLPAEMRGFVLGRENRNRESCWVTCVHARSHECDSKVGDEKHGGITLGLAREPTTSLEPEFIDWQTVPGLSLPELLSLSS